jgi:quercetin dioxygenase-like cupin family protein
MSQPYLRPSAPDQLTSLVVLGEGFSPLATAAETGGALTVMLWTSPEGSQLPKHLHQDADEAFFVLEGQLAITVGESFSVVALPGDFVFLPKGIAHSHRATGGQVARAFQILTPGGVEVGLAEVATLSPEEATPQRLAECAARANLLLLPE